MLILTYEQKGIFSLSFSLPILKNEFQRYMTYNIRIEIRIKYTTQEHLTTFSYDGVEYEDVRTNSTY